MGWSTRIVFIVFYKYTDAKHSAIYINQKLVYSIIYDRAVLSLKCDF